MPTPTKTIKNKTVKALAYGLGTAVAISMLTVTPAFAAKKNKHVPQDIVENTQTMLTAQADEATTTTSPIVDTPAPSSTSVTQTTSASTTTTTQDPAATLPPTQTDVTTTTGQQTATTSSDASTTPTPNPPTPTVDPTLPAAPTVVLPVVPVMHSKKPTPAPDKQSTNTNLVDTPSNDNTATTSASSTGPIASTGIGTLFGGGSIAGGDVYASTGRFDESETYKLLALSLALAAAGLVLTNTKSFGRRIDGLAGAFTLTPQRAARSRG